MTTFLLTSVLKGSDSKGKWSRCLPNTSTFVPNDRSQCLHCVLPIMRCAFGGHVQIRWRSHVSFPLSKGRWPSLIRQIRSAFGVMREAAIETRRQLLHTTVCLLHARTCVRQSCLSDQQAQGMPKTAPKYVLPVTS